jgi:single-stranded-DNA-specific exonuclease
MENTVLVGLRYLAARGLIDFENPAPDELTISKGDNVVRKELNQTEAKLKELLEESRAFRKYLIKATVQQIHDLMTGYATQTHRDDAMGLSV